MEIFSNILFKLIPLYVIIALGYIAGKYLKVDKESIAKSLMYIIMPVVFFYGIIKNDLQVNDLYITAFVFGMCLILAYLFLWLGSLIWQDARKNLLALCSSSGNYGYFGLPLSLVIFGEKALGLTILAMLGIMIFQNSFAYFITANGKYPISECLKKTLAVPNIYAIVLAFLMKGFLGVEHQFFQTISPVASQFIGTYSVLGIFMIGLGLANLKTNLKALFLPNLESLQFISLAFLAKFIAFPLITLAFIWLDNNALHWMNAFSQKVLLVLSLVPIPANALIIATTLKMDTDLISITIFWGNIFALFYIPLIVNFL